RALYSMPPAHGSAIIDIILHSDELTRQWQEELDTMRNRISGLRQNLVTSLNAIQQQVDFSFIARERGMFSFLGLTRDQVLQLRSEYSIYMTDNSRISIAGLRNDKLDYVAQAIKSVLAR